MNELKISRFGFETDIVLYDDYFTTLVIENKKLLYQYLIEIRKQIEDGIQGNFYLNFNNKAISFEQYVCGIFDFTDINLNSKIISNLLIKKFGEFLNNYVQENSIGNIESILFNLLEEFKIHSSINIEYNETITPMNIAKLCSLKISDDSMTILEKLGNYVDLMSNLKPLKLLILIFAKEYLNDIELSLLYKQCFDQQIRLLIIEQSDKSEVLTNEQRIIIDNDQCFIFNEIPDK